ncbi:MAG TPA: sulfur carrier protein ThiS [Spongiibacteraceae bacterium]|nr:sulfur carrier protein ThiS [Spongiibacteraceae bacterium]
MIDVFLNGERRVFDETKSLAVTLTESGFNCTRIAVAVNSEFVARSDYENYFLKAGDQLDVVAPVAGG